MPEYRRFVAYFYEYIDGKKQKNTGFAKVELRNGTWRILFRLTAPVHPEPPVEVFGFVRKEDYLLGLPMGTMRAGKEMMEEWAYHADEPVWMGKYGLSDLSGIWIRSGDERHFITVWDEEPVDTNRFVTKLPEKEREETENNIPGETAERASEQGKNIPEQTSHEISGKSSEGMSEKVPEEVSEEASEKISEKVPEEASEKISEKVSEETSEKALEEALEKVSEEVLEEASEKALEEVLEKVSEEVLEEASENISEKVSEETSEKVLEVESEKASENISETTSNQALAAALERVSDMTPEGERRADQTDMENQKLWDELYQSRSPFQPFTDQEIRDCIRIAPNDIMKLQRANWRTGRSSFLMHGYYNYRHLMIGRTADGKYVLGVPGIMNPQEKYLAVMFGFPNFKSSDGTKQETAAGYWYRILEQGVPQKS